MEKSDKPNATSVFKTQIHDELFDTDFSQAEFNIRYKQNQY